MSQVLYAEKAGYHVLKFVGDVRLSLGPAISGFLSRLRELEDCRGMVVDLSETEAIDSTALGLIAKLGICCRGNLCSYAEHRFAKRGHHAIAAEYGNAGSLCHHERTAYS